MKLFSPDNQPLNGFQVIEASAGCGKTYAICTLFTRLILERNLDAEEILTVTFTDAAAGELKTKIRNRIQDALKDSSNLNREQMYKLRTALACMDRVNISTIHGFCSRLLQEYAFDSGVSFDAELSANTDAIIDEIASDYFINYTANCNNSLFLEYIQYIGMTPKKMSGLLRKALGPGLIRIRPTICEAVNPSSLYRSAYLKAKDCLNLDRDYLEQLIVTHPSLSHKTYRRDYVHNWLDRLSAELSCSEPCLLTQWDLANRFSSSAIKDKTKEGKDPPSHDFFEAINELLQAYGLFDNLLLEFKLRFIEECRETFEKVKRDRELRTYDDMLKQVHSALFASGSEVFVSILREKFKAVLIDEFQDTDKVQYEIFERAFKYSNAPFFVIGDPKQSIYAFRGGDIYTYLQAVRAASENKFTLNTNYRSDPSMIRAVNTLFLNQTNPFLFEEICFTEVYHREGAEDLLAVPGSVGAIDFKFVSREEANVEEANYIPAYFFETNIPKAVAADIKKLLGQKDKNGNQITPSRIAVLVRTNKQAELFKGALNAASIAAVLLKDHSVFDTQEALNLHLLLRALNDPSNLSAITASLSSTLFGFTASDIQTIIEDSFELEKWTERFLFWRDLLNRWGLFRVFQEILSVEIDEPPCISGLGNSILKSPLPSSDECVKFDLSTSVTHHISLGERILSSNRGERIMTDYRHLCDLADRFIVQNGTAGTALIQWLEQRYQNAAAELSSLSEAELRLESESEAVEVLTMHKSKGLEFDIVYCPYLWKSGLSEIDDEALLYHSPEDDILTLDISGNILEQCRNQHLLEQEAESVRLTYVALTRAKHQCFVIMGAFNGLDNSSLGKMLFGELLKQEIPISDEEMIAKLKYWEDLSDEAIRISKLNIFSDEVETYKEELPADFLEVREFNVDIRHPLITSSFTSLTKGVEVEFETIEDEFENNNFPVTDNTGIRVPLESITNTEEKSLLNFCRGASAGIFLHTIFQNLDFETPKDETVVEALSDFGFDTEWKEPLFLDLRTILSKPLVAHDAVFSLSDISVDQRICEQTFLFPTTTEASLPNAISRLFTEYCQVCGRFYAEELGQLSLSSHSSYMRGFIDLVFEHRGKYYLADYKSNYLGAETENYNLEAIKTSMADHHYYLQYHLYATALHRRLTMSLKNYSYDLHFGGVFYLYLRGMTGKTKEPFGIFFDRPKQELIEGLSCLFKGQPILLPKQDTSNIPDKTQSVSYNTDSTQLTDRNRQLTLPGFFAPDTNEKNPGRGRK